MNDLTIPHFYTAQNSCPKSDFTDSDNTPSEPWLEALPSCQIDPNTVNIPLRLFPLILDPSDPIPSSCTTLTERALYSIQRVLDQKEGSTNSQVARHWERAFWESKPDERKTYYPSSFPLFFSLIRFIEPALIRHNNCTVKINLKLHKINPLFNSIASFLATLQKTICAETSTQIEWAASCAEQLHTKMAPEALQELLDFLQTQNQPLAQLLCNTVPALTLLTFHEVKILHFFDVGQDTEASSQTPTASASSQETSPTIRHQTEDPIKSDEFPPLQKNYRPAPKPSFSPIFLPPAFHVKNRPSLPQAQKSQFAHTNPPKTAQPTLPPHNKKRVTAPTTTPFNASPRPPLPKGKAPIQSQGKPHPNESSHNNTHSSSSNEPPPAQAPIKETTPAKEMVAEPVTEANDPIVQEETPSSAPQPDTFEPTRWLRKLDAFNEHETSDKKGHIGTLVSAALDDPKILASPFEMCGVKQAAYILEDPLIHNTIILSYTRFSDIRPLFWKYFGPLISKNINIQKHRYEYHKMVGLILNFYYQFILLQTNELTQTEINAISFVIGIAKERNLAFSTSYNMLIYLLRKSPSRTEIQSLVANWITVQGLKKTLNVEEAYQLLLLSRNLRTTHPQKVDYFKMAEALQNQGKLQERIDQKGWFDESNFLCYANLQLHKEKQVSDEFLESHFQLFTDNVTGVLSYGILLNILTYIADTRIFLSDIPSCKVFMQLAEGAYFGACELGLVRPHMIVLSKNAYALIMRIYEQANIDQITPFTLEISRRDVADETLNLYFLETSVSLFNRYYGMFISIEKRDLITNWINRLHRCQSITAELTRKLKMALPHLQWGGVVESNLFPFDSKQPDELTLEGIKEALIKCKIDYDSLDLSRQEQFLTKK